MSVSFTLLKALFCLLLFFFFYFFARDFDLCSFSCCCSMLWRAQKLSHFPVTVAHGGVYIPWAQSLAFTHPTNERTEQKKKQQPIFTESKIKSNKTHTDFVVVVAVVAFFYFSVILRYFTLLSFCILAISMCVRAFFSGFLVWFLIRNFHVFYYSIHIHWHGYFVLLAPHASVQSGVCIYI